MRNSNPYMKTKSHEKMGVFKRLSGFEMGLNKTGLIRSTRPMDKR